jgi:hypothetical protein
MVRSVGIGSVVLSLLALLPSCGGLSTEDSEQRCGQLRDAVPSCMTDAAYEACVSCYEDCGDSCDPSGTCPSTFTCSD